MTVSMDGLRWLLYIRKVMINHHKSGIRYICSLNKPLIIPHQVEEWPAANARWSAALKPAAAAAGKRGMSNPPPLGPGPCRKCGKSGTNGCQRMFRLGLGGKKNIKNTKKNGVFVRSSWKIYRFFFHVFCCNSTSLVAGWLAEIELEDPVCLTNGLAVLDTHIFLQGERVLRAGNMQRKLGDII